MTESIEFETAATSGGPGTYGVNGAPFSTVVADHGCETIRKIVVSTGFTAGTNLAALLRGLDVNGTKFTFGL